MFSLQIGEKTARNFEKMNKPIKAVFLDLSGVLYDGDRVIDGAVETVRSLRKDGLTLRFVTNTATRANSRILEKLSRMGFEVEDSALFTAPRAAQSYIETHGLRPYLIVDPAIKTMFERFEQQDPNCVVLGDAREGLNYSSLNRAFQLCRAGATLIAIGYNRYFSKGGELHLDSGAFAKAIEWAAGCEAMITGKPGAEFFKQVVDSTGLKPEQCLMVGDDLEGDVIGALDAGLQACLVRTGKFRPEDAEHLPPAALLVDSIADLEF